MQSIQGVLDSFEDGNEIEDFAKFFLTKNESKYVFCQIMKEKRLP